MPRQHGTQSGYKGGCRKECCRSAMRRAQEEYRMRVAKHGNVKIPVLGARRRINSLRAGGWPLSIIAAELGISVAAVGSILYKTRDKITWTLHARIASVFDRLGAKPGPSNSTRIRALAQGHYPPMAWDAETLDDPAAVPDMGSIPLGFDLDEWVFLVENGESPERAAERCGVTLGAVAQKAYRVGRNDIANLAEVARKRWSAA